MIAAWNQREELEQYIDEQTKNGANKHIDPPAKRSQDFGRSMMALGIWCPECGSSNTGDPGAATYCTTVCKDCGHRWDREKHKHDSF